MNARVDTLTGRVLNGRVFQPPAIDYPGDDPAAYVEAAARAAVTRWLDRLPARLRDADTASLHAQQQPAALTAWQAHPGARTLLLSGEPGVGKTWAAAAVATDLAVAGIRAGVGVLPEWWTVAGLLDELRPSSPRAEIVWARVKAAPVLVLDDLAHVRPTEWAAERVWLLANARAEAARARTVITTNATWDDLSGVWGPGTMDRLRDGAASVRLRGASLRRPVTLGARP